MGNPVTNMQHTNKDSEQILQPIHVRHWQNILWWVILIGIVLTVHELPKFLGNIGSSSDNLSTMESGMEKEAFIALVFGKVSATKEMAIPASSFKADLTALKQAGYSSVRIEQIHQWQQTDTKPLAIKPVLLTFEEANKETLEIADSLLQELGMTALVFVDVNQLNQANMHLVSWHKLELMAKSGRWEVGISGCLNSNEEPLISPIKLAEKMSLQRELLEDRLQIPIVSADCSRHWYSKNGARAAAWNQVLKAASLHTGFVVAPFGANYRTDPPSSYSRIRVSRNWNQTDLLSQLKNHAPRRKSFVDNFDSEDSSDAWIVDSGEISIKQGSFRIFNNSGENGALVMLSGTEKWQDADVEVQLQGLPKGQFWISLRQGTSKPSVRLGIAHGQVMLQQSNRTGEHHLLSRSDAPIDGITLRLRVVGSRAIGYLNGQPLLTRPVEMPEYNHHGSFALAVWNNSNIVDTVESGEASANLVKVTATPLFTKGVIIASTSTTTENVWTQLRQIAGELSLLSPGYFAWIDGKPQASDVDISMQIFARFHHLKLLPAVFIDEDTPLSDTASIANQALAWVTATAYDGLNFVIKSKMAESAEWRLFLSNLNENIHNSGKTLKVTILDSNKPQNIAAETDQLILVTAKQDLLQVEPELLYLFETRPMNSNANLNLNTEVKNINLTLASNKETSSKITVD